MTSPLLALAALGIKLQDHGPVLFKQTRIGRHGAAFTLYKLRTMHEGAEHQTGRVIDLNARDGPLVKIPNDPRTTLVGRVLRTASIDELPQLWNVINGTMSLVGPRPALPDEVVHFDSELRAREAVLPGITGLWQVEGRDNPSFAAYRRFDLFYLQNWTVTLDVMILLGTVESVVTRALRSVLRRGDEIALAPPAVKDPAAQARRPRAGTEREVVVNGGPAAHSAVSRLVAMQMQQRNEGVGELRQPVGAPLVVAERSAVRIRDVEGGIHPQNVVRSATDIQAPKPGLEGLIELAWPRRFAERNELGEDEGLGERTSGPASRSRRLCAVHREHQRGVGDVVGGRGGRFVIREVDTAGGEHPLGLFVGRAACCSEPATAPGSGSRVRPVVGSGVLRPWVIGRRSRCTRTAPWSWHPTAPPGGSYRDRQVFTVSTHARNADGL